MRNIKLMHTCDDASYDIVTCMYSRIMCIGVRAEGPNKITLRLYQDGTGQPFQAPGVAMPYAQDTSM